LLGLNAGTYRLEYSTTETFETGTFKGVTFEWDGLNSYVVENLLPGTTYWYRIRATDGDNSNVVQVTTTGESGAGLNTIQADGFQLWPNPAKDILNISTDNTEAQFKITTAEGQVVKQGTINGKGTVSVLDLASGLYVVSLKNANVVVTKKLIIK
jgi:hypothetical protein